MELENILSEITQSPKNPNQQVLEVRILEGDSRERREGFKEHRQCKCGKGSVKAGLGQEDGQGNR